MQCMNYVMYYLLEGSHLIEWNHCVTEIWIPVTIGTGIHNQLLFFLIFIYLFFFAQAWNTIKIKGDPEECHFFQLYASCMDGCLIEKQCCKLGVIEPTIKMWPCFSLGNNLLCILPSCAKSKNSCDWDTVTLIDGLAQSPLSGIVI